MHIELWWRNTFVTSPQCVVLRAHSFQKDNLWHHPHTSPESSSCKNKSLRDVGDSTHGREARCEGKSFLSRTTTVSMLIENENQRPAGSWKSSAASWRGRRHTIWPNDSGWCGNRVLKAHLKSLFQPCEQWNPKLFPSIGCLTPITTSKGKPDNVDNGMQSTSESTNAKREMKTRTPDLWIEKKHVDWLLKNYKHV